MNLRSEKIIGTLFITGAVLVLIPYTLLTRYFSYPDILRETPAVIFTRFYEGGVPLIVMWWAFALLGLPILAGYVLLGQKLETKHSLVRLATYFGIISAVLQIIGLLRWVFVMPILASNFVTTSSEIAKEAIVVVFQMVHQYGGVALGEHLGQLFTIAWMVLMAIVFDSLKLMPKWVVWFGYITAGIYFLAQAELIATVIPSFPIWGLAGFLGSTLWLVWMVIIGVRLFNMKID